MHTDRGMVNGGAGFSVLHAVSTVHLSLPAPAHFRQDGPEARFWSYIGYNPGYPIFPGTWKSCSGTDVTIVDDNEQPMSFPG